MNNRQLKFYFKILFFTLLFFIACGLQTSFWPNVIAIIPSPQIWLIMIIFITIKWPPLFTIFYIYFLGFCLTSFSDIPLSMIWSTTLVVFTSLLVIKNRIQLTGAFSFVILVLFGSLTFEITYYYFSDLLETIPASIMFYDRILQVLVNFIFCYPLYFILDKADILIFDEQDWTRSSKDYHAGAQHE